MGPKTESQECPFCTLDKKFIIAENEYFLAIRDGFPVSRGHTLLIPRRHAASWFDLTADEVTAMTSLLVLVKSSLDTEFSPAGYNIGWNDGAQAGQTVMHFHLHLIPRYPGDVRDPRGGIRWIFPDKAQYWQD